MTIFEIGLYVQLNVASNTNTAYGAVIAIRLGLFGLGVHVVATAIAGAGIGAWLVQDRPRQSRVLVGEPRGRDRGPRVVEPRRFDPHLQVPHRPLPGSGFRDARAIPDLNAVRRLLGGPAGRPGTPDPGARGRVAAGRSTSAACGAVLDLAGAGTLPALATQGIAGRQTGWWVLSAVASAAAWLSASAEIRSSSCSAAAIASVIVRDPGAVERVEVRIRLAHRVQPLEEGAALS